MVDVGELALTQYGARLLLNKPRGILLGEPRDALLVPICSDVGKRQILDLAPGVRRFFLRRRPLR